MSVAPRFEVIESILAKVKLIDLSSYSITVLPCIYIVSESLPKPMMENLQPGGRLLIKILRASWAVSMRL